MWKGGFKDVNLCRRYSLYQTDLPVMICDEIRGFSNIGACIAGIFSSSLGVLVAAV